MQLLEVRVHRSDENLAREDQLAWKIAEVAADPVEVTDEVAEMVVNRIIDNAAVATASLGRASALAARAQAEAHPVSTGGAGSTVFGVGGRHSPEWAAWANGVAVRELDYHDTFLAAEYSHPGDNIPPILAVAQHLGKSGHELIRGIATGYEIQIDLVKAISLHAHKIDHVAHLGPSAAAGIGTLLGLDRDDLPGHRPGAARDHGHAPVAQGRDLQLEGLRAGLRGQDGGRSRRPGHARPDQPDADLRGRGRRDRLAARRSGRALRGSAAGARRGQARHPRQLHQGALRRVPGAGLDRPRAQARAAASRTARPGERHPRGAAHQPPHPLRDRLRRERPAEVRPDGQPGDPRPLDPVHLRRRTAGRRVAPRAFIRAGACGPARHRRALAQGQHRGRPGVDPPLPLARPEGEGVRRPGRDRPRRRNPHCRRDRGRRRASAGRPPVRARAVHRQVQKPRGWRARAGRDRALSRHGSAPSRAGCSRIGWTHRHPGNTVPRDIERDLLMLYSHITPATKRQLLREHLATGQLLRYPGAFNPLSAKLIEDKGFEGVYISGAVISADLGLPDIGLTTLTEVAGRAQQINRMTSLPTLVDADTGFGEPMNVARTVQELENAGVTGIHIEDQVNPKRCGHLDGKAVVDEGTATKRIRAAMEARRDPNLLIMARTDIRAIDGHGIRNRPGQGPRGCRGRRDLPRGDARPGRVRGRAEGRRRADPGEHDRVRQERAVHHAAARRRRRQHRDLPGHPAAQRHGRRRAYARPLAVRGHPAGGGRRNADSRSALRTAGL